MAAYTLVLAMELRSARHHHQVLKWWFTPSPPTNTHNMWLVSPCRCLYRSLSSMATADMLCCVGILEAASKDDGGCECVGGGVGVWMIRECERRVSYLWLWPWWWWLWWAMDGTGNGGEVGKHVYFTLSFVSFCSDVVFHMYTVHPSVISFTGPPPLLIWLRSRSLLLHLHLLLLLLLPSCSGCHFSSQPQTVLVKQVMRCGRSNSIKDPFDGAHRNSVYRVVLSMHV